MEDKDGFLKQIREALQGFDSASTTTTSSSDAAVSSSSKANSDSDEEGPDEIKKKA